MLKNACRTCSTIIWVLLTNNITAFWHCHCLATATTTPQKMSLVEREEKQS